MHPSLPPDLDHVRHVTRRHFLQRCTLKLGALWLAGEAGFAGRSPEGNPLAPQPPPFAPKAKRVIYLHMAGSPSQLELFDYKPELTALDGRDCPAEFLAGKQFAFIQGVPKMMSSRFPFHRAGQSGTWISDRLPHLETVIDELCVVKSMYTDQFNHAPAQLLVHTGTQTPGAASMGAWATYGLGSLNDNLPGFIVLTSGGANPDAGKSVWGSGCLPSVYQGVQCRSQGDPVLFLSNPAGIDHSMRRRTLDALAAVNESIAAEYGDPETRTRIAQYELASRMQIHAADAFDISREPESIHEMYGTRPGQESFANNCLLARRLAERGVRYIQLFDWGWDSHGTGPGDDLHHAFVNKCRQIDQPVAALLRDLKQRGMLEETLVIWSGEFGRTPMRENRGGVEMSHYGRDHNPGAFTLWMAGGGVKGGYSHGETDPVGYTAVRDRVSVHDFHATVLHLLGFDHEKFTFPFQGANHRLTNFTKSGTRVVHELIA